MMKLTTHELQKKFWEKDKSKRRSSEHPIVRYVFESKAKKLKYLTNDIHPQSILDCGCGNGFFQTYLSKTFNLECAGLDFSSEMIRFNPNPNTIIASVTNIPFKDNSFDIVVCHGLLHHLPKESHLLAVNEMARVARYYLFLAEPNRNNPAIALFSIIKPEERCALLFSKKYLQKLCKQNKQLSIVKIFTDLLVLPNKTPLFLFPVMKRLDKSSLSSYLGTMTNILCRKINPQL